MAYKWRVAGHELQTSLANKQILHESIQQLHRLSRWHMFDYHERKTKRPKHIFQLLTPGSGQIVRIHLNIMRSNSISTSWRRIPWSIRS
jgi:hypothetical protein